MKENINLLFRNILLEDMNQIDGIYPSNQATDYFYFIGQEYLVFYIICIKGYFGYIWSNYLL